MTDLPASISAVVLAAGQATRMGASKQLALLGGEPLVRRSTRQVLDAGYRDVLVVLGREADRVREALEDLPVRFTVNGAYRDGLSTSFRAGIDALPDTVEAAVFLLADMVFVTPRMYREVAQAHLTTGAPMVLALYDGVRAPPHLFHRSLFGRFGHDGDHGPKHLVREYHDAAALVDLPGWALRDIDTPDDLAAAEAWLRDTGGLPPELARLEQARVR